MTLPTAISSDVLKIGTVELVVHVLDNGERVIDADSAARFFECLGDPSNDLLDEETVRKLALHIRGE